MTPYWIMLIYSLLLCKMIIFRNSIRDGTKFNYQCQRFPPMISWKVCANWEYMSPRNSKPYWNCTTWRFIRGYRCPIIRNWRQWWREEEIRNSDCETLTPGTGKSKQEHWSSIERDFAALKEERVPITSGKKKANVPRETSAVSRHENRHLLSHQRH